MASSASNSASIHPNFHIASLSPGYAESELRRPWKGDGEYAPALRMLAEKRSFHDQPRYDSATINVSNMTGFDLHACNGDEGLLVEKVVERVVEMFGIPLPATWQLQAHDQLEGAASDAISVLHPKNANGPDIEMGVQQPVESNNNNQQPDIEMGVVQPSESNNNNQQDLGIVASDGNADTPNHSKGRGYVKNISIIFATSQAAILSAACAMGSLAVSSMARKNILLVSALVSAATIGALVVKSFEEFKSFEETSGNRCQQPLCDSIAANCWWVIKRIALVLIFIILSVFLLSSSKSLLKIRHH